MTKPLPPAQRALRRRYIVAPGEYRVDQKRGIAPPLGTGSDLVAVLGRSAVARGGGADGAEVAGARDLGLGLELGLGSAARLVLGL